MVSDTAERPQGRNKWLQNLMDAGGKPFFVLGLVLVALSIFAGLATAAIISVLTMPLARNTVELVDKA